MLRERWGAANSTKQTILRHAQPRAVTGLGLVPRGNIMAAPLAVGDVDMRALVSLGHNEADGWAPTRDGYMGALVTHGMLTGIVE